MKDLLKRTMTVPMLLAAASRQHGGAKDAVSTAMQLASEEAGPGEEKHGPSACPNEEGQ